MVARWGPSTGFCDALRPSDSREARRWPGSSPGPDGRSHNHGGWSASTLLLPGPSFGSRSIRPCRCAPFSRSARPLRLESLEAGSNRSGDTQVLPFSIMFLHAQVLPFSIVIYTEGPNPSSRRESCPCREPWSAWSSRQRRLVGNTTSSSGRADGQPPAARRTARYSSMTITGLVSTGQSLGWVSESRSPPSSGSVALTASSAAWNSPTRSPVVRRRAYSRSASVKRGSPARRRRRRSSNSSSPTLTPPFCHPAPPFGALPERRCAGSAGLPPGVTGITVSTTARRYASGLRDRPRTSTRAVTGRHPRVRQDRLNPPSLDRRQSAPIWSCCPTEV